MHCLALQLTRFLLTAASELNGEDDIFSQLQKVVTSVAALTASVSTKADLAALTTKVDTLTANLDGLQQQLTQTQQLLAAAQTNAGLRSMNVWAQPSGNNGLELQQLVVEDAPGVASPQVVGPAHPRKRLFDTWCITLT